MLKRYDTLEDGAAGFMLLRQSIEELEIELAEARAEIEQMREALQEARSPYCEKTILAALAAERGE